MADCHYPGSQEPHKQLIASIVADRGLQTKSFWKALNALAEQEDWFDPPRKQPFIPDAFKVDRENRTLEIHEAVVTHPPAKRALLCMGALWFHFDSEYWDVKLFLHRPDQVEPAEVDLQHWYYEIIKQGRAARLSPTPERPIHERGSE